MTVSLNSFIIVLSYNVDDDDDNAHENFNSFHYVGEEKAQMEYDRLQMIVFNKIQPSSSSSSSEVIFLT